MLRLWCRGVGWGEVVVEMGGDARGRGRVVWGWDGGRIRMALQRWVESLSQKYLNACEGLLYEREAALPTDRTPHPETLATWVK